MARIQIKDCVAKIGENVELAGWVDVRRDHGKLIFIDLRDASGVVQMVITPSDKELHKIADTVRPEWVIAVGGTVQERPKGMQNPDIPTGTVEVAVTGLKVLSEAKTPPFALDTDGREISEELRMEYRYLDLRRSRMARNIRTRHQVIQFMRSELTGRGFVEIETPMLTKSTPEGARDYVVPARQHAGSFYALPQSPQQYKQLLMVAGFEKYFQIARCFRDEDTRGDRQPEFTQLDIEMSFITQDDILELIETLYISLVKTLFPQKKIQQIPFPRITYKEAMEKYQSDKPDIRKNKNDPDELAFVFVVDFPMFEWKETEKRWDAVHHPFTKVRRASDSPEDIKDAIKRIKEKPAEQTADQYDFVLNGYEIGGGSIREHRPEVLQAVFEAMGHASENVREKFGHILRAFEYGVSPHGGIAPGIDRLLMILASEPNIREVIAFPKTGDGRDLMMDSPAAIEPEQLRELGLEIRKKE